MNSYVLEKGKKFFFYCQEAEIYFFLNFRLGLLRIIQAVSALLVEMSLKEVFKKKFFMLLFLGNLDFLNQENMEVFFALLGLDATIMRATGDGAASKR